MKLTEIGSCRYHHHQGTLHDLHLDFQHSLSVQKWVKKLIASFSQFFSTYFISLINFWIKNLSISQNSLKCSEQISLNFHFSLWGNLLPRSLSTLLTALLFHFTILFFRAYQFEIQRMTEVVLQTAPLLYPILINFSKKSGGVFT
jgi:hypothetical protein